MSVSTWAFFALLVDVLKPCRCLRDGLVRFESSQGDVTSGGLRGNVWQDGGTVDRIVSSGCCGFFLRRNKFGVILFGWDVHDQNSVARTTLAMMSDWFPMTTGEIVHVDGGYHAMGA